MSHVFRALTGQMNRGVAALYMSTKAQYKNMSLSVGQWIAAPSLWNFHLKRMQLIGIMNWTCQGKTIRQIIEENAPIEEMIELQETQEEQQNTVVDNLPDVPIVDTIGISPLNPILKVLLFIALPLILLIMIFKRKK